MTKVGDVLRKKRKNLGLTLEEVYKNTKIPIRFIKALEEGDYSVFSNKVHAKGFLKNYTKFLNLDVEQILAFWRREYEVYFERLESQKPKKKIFAMGTPRFVVSPAIFASLFALLLVVLFFGYLFFQYRTYAAPPELIIASPTDNQVVYDDVLDVTGKTDLDSQIFLNDQQLVLNQNGSFATSIKLNKGINNLNFRAINKLGRETSASRLVILKKESDSVRIIETPVSQTSESSTSIKSDSSSDVTLIAE